MIVSIIINTLIFIINPIPCENTTDTIINAIEATMMNNNFNNLVFLVFIKQYHKS